MKRFIGLVVVVFGFLVACSTPSDEGEIVTIHFEALGGVRVESIEVASNATTVSLPTPERDGYRFLGWTVTEGSDQAFDVSALEGVSEITLFASWEAVSDDDDEDDPEFYTVSFTTNVADQVLTQSVEAGAQVSVPTDLVLEGYDFGGWYLDEFFSTPFDAYEGVNEDLTLYALWLERFTVRFMEDDTVLEIFSVTDGNTVPLPDALSKEGHLFLGWFDGDTQFTASQVVREDLDLFARFEVESYGVQFSLGAHGMIDAMSFEFGQTITLPDPPEVSNYAFRGWYLDASFNEAFDLDVMPAGELVLYARYAQTVTVTFRLSSEEVYHTVELYEGDMVSLPDAPEVAGYEFLGWDFAGDLVTEDFQASHSMALMAEFSRLGFAVTFDTQGADSFAPMILKTDETLDLPAPVKEGYVFAGWYLDAAFEEVLTKSTMPAEDLHLYARWLDESTPYTVADIINVRPETVYIEDYLVRYSKAFTLDQETLTLTYLTDGVHVITVIDDVVFEVGDYVSFEAVLRYEGLIPVIVDVGSSVSVSGQTDSVPSLKTTVSFNEFMAFDHTNPWLVGREFVISGFAMLDGGGMFVDLESEDLSVAAIMNLTVSDVEALEHTYLRGGFVLAPIFESEMRILLYDEDIEHLSSVTLTDREKLETLDALLNLIFSNEQVSPGDVFELPEADPFFNTTLDLSVIEAYAEYYDAEEAVFLWTDELVHVGFSGTITLNDETQDVSFSIRLAPHLTYALDQIQANRLVSTSVRGVVVYLDDDVLVLQDETGLVILDNHLTRALSVGDEIVVNAMFDLDATILTGFTQWFVYHLSSNNDATIDAAFVCVEAITECATRNLSSYGSVEGILEQYHGAYNSYYRLRLDNATVMLVLDPSTNADDLLSDFVGRVVSVSGVLRASDLTNGLPSLTLYGVASFEDTLATREATDEEVINVAKTELAHLDALFRPNRAYSLEENFFMGVNVTYAFDAEGIAHDFDEDSMQVTFLEEGVMTLTLTYEFGDTTVTKTYELTVEDYVITNISDAELNETAYFFVEVKTVIGGAIYYIARDETGVVKLDPYSMGYWPIIGETYIVKGELVEVNGIYYLEGAQIVEAREGTFAESDAVLYTIEDLKAFDEPYSGIVLVEVEGYVRYGDMTMALYEAAETGDFIDLFISAPYDAVLFDIDPSTPVRVLAYYTRDFLDRNVLVYITHEAIE